MGPEDEAVIFPDTDAQVLAKLLDDWAHEFSGKRRANWDDKSGWDTSEDSVDGASQWQTMIYSHGRDEDDERRTAYNPYHVPTDGVPGYRNHHQRSSNWESVGPLAAALHRDVFLPRMKHIGHEDVPMHTFFMRKYSPLSRTTIRAHQDTTVMTFNIALSDRSTTEGGSLFICDKLPQSYADMMTSNSVLGDGKGNWFEHLYPESEYTSGEGVCKVAQAPMGSMVSHLGARFHGVQPIRGGTRFSLIAFYGDSHSSPSDFHSRMDLIRGFQDEVIKLMPDREVDAWLHGLQSASADGTQEGHCCVFGDAPMAGLQLSSALKHFMGSAKRVTKVLAVLEEFCTGDWLPEDVRRELADRGAVELLRQARELHPGYEKIGQLSCSILSFFSCGSQSCAEGIPSCADYAEASSGPEVEEDEDEDDGEDDLEREESEKDIVNKTPRGMNWELTPVMEDLYKDCGAFQAEIMENTSALPVPTECLGLLRWVDYGPDAAQCSKMLPPDLADSRAVVEDSQRLSREALAKARAGGEPQEL
jgi:hypothetical protein